MSDGDLLYIEDETDGRLGRNVVWHDPRNRNFPISALIGAPELRTYSWYRRHLFDQGRESSCTAQAAAGVKMSSPFKQKAISQWLDDPAERFTLYQQAQYEDPWPGQHYDGSSTDAPFKVLRIRGYIREWRWAFGLREALQTISHHGPVAIGVNWYAEMMDTDAKGYLWPRGRLVGGHAVELYGINVAREDVIGVNSWGNWGAYQNGKFRMTWDALGELLKANGEAVTIVV